jgi:hypothetical protein
MPQFQIGDFVERMGSFVPEYLRSGVVTNVIPNEELDLFTQYEVHFGNQIIATFYEIQLRLVQSNQNPGSGLNRLTA